MDLAAVRPVPLPGKAAPQCFRCCASAYAHETRVLWSVQPNPCPSWLYLFSGYCRLLDLGCCHFPCSACERSHHHCYKSCRCLFDNVLDVAYRAVIRCSSSLLEFCNGRGCYISASGQVRLAHMQSSSRHPALLWRNGRSLPPQIANSLKGYIKPVTLSASGV